MIQQAGYSQNLNQIPPTTHPLLHLANKRKDNLWSLNTKGISIEIPKEKEINNKEKPHPPTETTPTPEKNPIDHNGIHRDVKKFIWLKSKTFHAVKMQVLKWRDTYLKKQQKEYDKFVKSMEDYGKPWMMRQILNCVVLNPFWAKKVWTFSWLNKKDRDWFPLWLSIMDDMNRKWIRY